MPQQTTSPTLEQAARQLYTIVGEGQINELIIVDPLIEMDLRRALDDVLAALNLTERVETLARQWQRHYTNAGLERSWTDCLETAYAEITGTL